MKFVSKRAFGFFGAAALVVLADYFLVLTDCIIAGRVLGESALGAMNLMMPCFAITAFFQCLVASGAFALYAKAWRQRDGDSAARYGGTGLFATAIASLAIIGVLFLMENPYIAFMAPDPFVTEFSSNYWRWYLPTVFLSGIEMMLFFLVFSRGGTGTCFNSYFLQVAVNVAASYALALRYGMSGLSAGSVIAYAVGIAALLPRFLGTNRIALVRALEVRPLVTSFRHSFADSWVWLVQAVIFFVITKYIIAVWGSESLPVCAVVFCILRLTGFFAGIGVAIRVADEKREFFRTFSSLSFALMGFLTVIFFVAPELLISIFGIEDPELYEGTKLAARITVAALVVCVILAFVPLWLRVRKTNLPEAPLNYLQNYVLSRMSEDGDDAHMFNLVKLFKLRKGVDLERLSKALCESARTHAALLSVLKRDVDGEIVQCEALKADDIQCPIESADEAELLSRKNSLVSEFGDFGKCLLNARIFDCGERAYLLSDFHHLICDGFSFPLILEGARKIYNGEALESGDYYAVLAKRREKYATPMAEATRMLMREKLMDPRYVTLPKPDFAATPAYGVYELPIVLPENFEQFLAERRVTRHHVFMAATVLALRRLTGGEDILIDWVFHGRVSKEELKTVGSFMVDLPLVVENMSELTAGDVLSRVKQATFTGIKNVGSIGSVEDVNPDGRDRLTFIYQDQWGELMSSGPVREDGPYAWMIDETYEISAPVTRIENPFNVEIMEHREGTRLRLEYDAGRYSADTVSRYAECFKEEILRITDNIAND